MSTRGRILGLESIDTEEALRNFVKSAETTMDLGASAQEHLDGNNCRDASMFALRMGEEVGVTRGVMTQVASEVRQAEQDILRVGRRPELLQQRERLTSTLEAMEEDFEFLQTRRDQIFNAVANRCACGPAGSPVAPSSFTTRPSDGEEDG